MASRVSNVRIKDKKLVRTHRLSVSKKIGARAKADREEKAWKARSK